MLIMRFLLLFAVLLFAFGGRINALVQRLGHGEGAWFAGLLWVLLAAIAVDETDMRELAQARAQAVREVLLGLNVPAVQLFLGAPVVAKASSASAFVPKVLLAVSTD